MESGHIYKVFKSNDGRKVILRTVKWEDIDNLAEFANSLIDEGAEITLDKKQTRESEADYLAQTLAAVEKNEMISVVAEADGKVVGNSSVTRYSRISQSHMGMSGISVRAGYRDTGIGTEMMRVLIEESRKMGLKLLILDVFGTNERARHVYEKMGFKEVGRIPDGLFRNGKYVDDVRMAFRL
nr:GNAT family protein [Candidatus Njordarchaeota archaeon]